MSNLNQLLDQVVIPDFFKVRYEMPQKSLTDIPASMNQALEQSHVLCRIKKGMRIAVTAGSRQMGQYPLLVRALLDRLRECEAEVFLVPAMGSHGGASAKGQRAVLAKYGITEETMGVPVYSSMETVSLGFAKNGMEVRMDRFAYEADGIVVFNRIKAHTGFRGPIESGLMKMIAIGLGKQHGAGICHSDRPENMSENIRQIASHAIERAPILFGVGVIENAFHMPYRIRAMVAEDIWQEEQKLLLEAKLLMPRIPFEKADVLILDEIGKDIAGEGMDPNITGRSFFIGNKAPYFESIAVLDITEASDGNGTGIGNADVISRRAFDKFRMDITYQNCITSRDAKSTKIPVTMPNDRLVLQYALQICYGIDKEKGPRIVWLKNTLRLDTFYLSAAMLEEARNNSAIEVQGETSSVVFDENGNIIQHEY